MTQTGLTLWGDMARISVVVTVVSISENLCLSVYFFCHKGIVTLTCIWVLNLVLLCASKEALDVNVYVRFSWFLCLCKICCPLSEVIAQRQTAPDGRRLFLHTHLFKKPSSHFIPIQQCIFVLTMTDRPLIVIQGFCFTMQFIFTPSHSQYHNFL